MLNTKLECHLVGPHALSHEVSAYIYIYIYIYIDGPVVAALWVGKHTQEDTYP